MIHSFTQISKYLVENITVYLLPVNIIGVIERSRDIRDETIEEDGSMDLASLSIFYLG